MGKQTVTAPSVLLSVPKPFTRFEKVCRVLLIGMSYFLVIIFFPFSLCFCLKVVNEYERIVMFRLGRLCGNVSKKPGVIFVLPCVDDFWKVDLRTMLYDVPYQEILTKDSVTVAVNAVVYYRIYDANMAITNVQDWSTATRLLGATTLRNILGTKTLSEVLVERESISQLIREVLDEATDIWGVAVKRVEMKDVRLPTLLQRAMASEAEAAREAKARVASAEGEKQASSALKAAAEIIAESSTALQLRYLQTLISVSSEKNSTIIVPLPIDVLSKLFGKSK